MFEAVFAPGTQTVGVANRFPNVPLQIGHDVPGALRRQRLRIGREVVVADVPALPKDHLADEARVLLPIGEDPFKQPPVGVADALTWRQPDAMIGTDCHHILEMQLLQFADKIAALPIQAVCQYDLEAEAPVLQLLDNLHRQCWLRLIGITWLEPGPGFEDLEEQGKGDLIQDAIGVDGHNAILELTQIANLLMGHVIGGVAFLAVTRLINAPEERAMVNAH